MRYEIPPMAPPEGYACASQYPVVICRRIFFEYCILPLLIHVRILLCSIFAHPLTLRVQTPTTLQSDTIFENSPPRCPELPPPIRLRSLRRSYISAGSNRTPLNCGDSVFDKGNMREGEHHRHQSINEARG